MKTFKQYICELDVNSISNLIKKNEELLKNPTNSEQKTKAENEIKRLQSLMIDMV